MRKAFLAALEENWNALLNHQAFADWLDENDEPELADLHRSWTPAKQAEAQDYLDEYALKCWHSEGYLQGSRWWQEGDPVKAEVTSANLISYAHGWLNTWNGKWGEEWFVQYGSETAIDQFDPDKFWPAFEVLTGRLVPQKYRIKESFVSCTC